MKGPWAVMKYSGSRRTRGVAESLVSRRKSWRSGSTPLIPIWFGIVRSKNLELTLTWKKMYERPLCTNTSGDQKNGRPGGAAIVFTMVQRSTRSAPGSLR
jgi:hypothetical protein